MKCSCKHCGGHFSTKLTLQEKTNNFQPKYCSQQCAMMATLTKQRTIKKPSNRIPKISKEEKAFGLILKSYFPKLKEQYQIIGYDHHYDFYSPELNLIIEYNGVFWHNMPKNRVQDRHHLNEATKNSIHVAVITDKEWKLFMNSGLPDRKKILKLLNHSIKNMQP